MGLPSAAVVISIPTVDAYKTLGSGDIPKAGISAHNGVELNATIQQVQRSRKEEGDSVGMIRGRENDESVDMVIADESGNRYHLAIDTKNLAAPASNALSAMRKRFFDDGHVTILFSQSNLDPKDIKMMKSGVVLAMDDGSKE